VALGEGAVLVAVVDELNELLGQSLLLRTCEAKVPSDAAVVDPGIAEPPHLLRRLVEGSLGPQHAVEKVEAGEQIGLVVED
jgi:hypothetical protein